MLRSIICAVVVAALVSSAQAQDPDLIVLTESESGNLATQGGRLAGISGNGRFVVFRSNATNLVPDDSNQRPDIFVHDRVSGTTARVGQPPGEQSNGSSSAPAISGDGQWIVFESDASNLVPGDTNEARDVFRAPNPLFTAVTAAQ